MNNEINEVYARRTRAYERAVAKSDRIELECRAYEKANDGFLSSELVDKYYRASIAQSKSFKVMTQAWSLL